MYTVDMETGPLRWWWQMGEREAGVAWAPGRAFLAAVACHNSNREGWPLCPTDVDLERCSKCISSYSGAEEVGEQANPELI